jgi:hypothetical protein
MGALETASNIIWNLQIIAEAAIIILAVVGAVQVAMTREDAFTVIDRGKMNWILSLGGCALAVLIFFGAGVGFMWIIAAVVVGVYWQDVRPAIREVLGNAQ